MDIQVGWKFNNNTEIPLRLLTQALKNECYTKYHSSPAEQHSKRVKLSLTLGLAESKTQMHTDT